MLPNIETNIVKTVISPTTVNRAANFLRLIRTSPILILAYYQFYAIVPDEPLLEEQLHPEEPDEAVLDPELNILAIAPDVSDPGLLLKILFPDFTARAPVVSALCLTPTSGLLFRLVKFPIVNGMTFPPQHTHWLVIVHT
jgi:hypothetical protein